MQGSDVNLLFSIAYALDDRRRIGARKTRNSDEQPQLFVVFTHEELEKLAEDLRIMAQRNEGTPESRRESARHKSHRTVSPVPACS
jgi:hypothetical protein